MVLAECLLEALGAGERAGAERVILRGAQSRAFEGEPRLVVVGVRAHGLGVFDDGQVVVLGDFRAFAGAKGGGRARARHGGAAGHQSQADAERAQPRSTISA